MVKRKPTAKKVAVKKAVKKAVPKAESKPAMPKPAVPKMPTIVVSVPIAAQMKIAKRAISLALISKGVKATIEVK